MKANMQTLLEEAAAGGELTEEQLEAIVDAAAEVLRALLAPTIEALGAALALAIAHGWKPTDED